MSEKNSFTDLVFSLSNKDFQLLQDAVEHLVEIKSTMVLLTS